MTVPVVRSRYRQLMPLQNRVTPGGEIVATTARGSFMGNRGILHDEAKRIVRQSRTNMWLICRLEFKGRRREVMGPGKVPPEPMRFKPRHNTKRWDQRPQLRLVDTCSGVRPADGQPLEAVIVDPVEAPILPTLLGVLIVFFFTRRRSSPGQPGDLAPPRHQGTARARRRRTPSA